MLSGLGIRPVKWMNPELKQIISAEVFWYLVKVGGGGGRGEMNGKSYLLPYMYIWM